MIMIYVHDIHYARTHTSTFGEYRITIHTGTFGEYRITIHTGASASLGLMNALTFPKLDS